MKVYFLFMLLFSPLFLRASDTSKYQRAYEMEKVSTLFAIPLYEQTLQNSNAKNLQKAAVNRLFYLYKKHNKIIESLILVSKYSHIISQKEKSGIWKKLSEIYKPLTYSELTTAYVLALKSGSENYTELLEYLHSSNNPKLFEFVYIFLYKKKNFETLEKLFIQDHSLSNSPLYEGIVLIKLNPERGKEFLSNAGFDLDKDEAVLSDLLYLLGMYFRALGENETSARYFRMSSSYHWTERGKLESAKSLVLAGRIGEACQTFTFTPSPNEEINQILHLICVKKDKHFLTEIKPSLFVLAAREGGEFFQKINSVLDKIL